MLEAKFGENLPYDICLLSFHTNSNKHPMNTNSAISAGYF